VELCAACVRYVAEWCCLDVSCRQQSDDLSLEEFHEAIKYVKVLRNYYFVS